MRAFLLIECAGPWGVNALRDCRLPSEVTGELQRRSRRLGIRPLLIRRHGRHEAGLSVFAAYAHPQRPWLEYTHLEDPAQLLDLDLAAFSQGRSLGLIPFAEPLFLVCTHGRHDRCCAERGRPIAKALTDAYPDATWEVSHIGGDRFAGNVVVLPEGLYYGRLDAASAVAMAEDHLDGRLDLAHLRGRSGYGFAVQAADWFLRRELALAGLSDLQLVARRSTAGGLEAEFLADDRRWLVRVRQTQNASELLTCSASSESPSPHFELDEIRQLPLDAASGA